MAVLVAVFAGDGSYVSAHAFTNGFTAAIDTAAGLFHVEPILVG